MNGWLGVDLDGTLARYDGWQGVEHVGEPIPAMVERVRGWLEHGHPVYGRVEVRIMTARVYGDQGAAAPRDRALVPRRLRGRPSGHLHEGLRHDRAVG